jgi:hypothetical protein
MDAIIKFFSAADIVALVFTLFAGAVVLWFLRKKNEPPVVDAGSAAAQQIIPTESATKNISLTESLNLSSSWGSTSSSETASLSWSSSCRILMFVNGMQGGKKFMNASKPTILH